MDAVDGRILAHLVHDPLASVADLCEPAGLTRNAVRARLDRLREAGVLPGFMGAPNPALFGRTGLVAVYPAPKASNPPADAVLAVDELVSFSVNHDSKLAGILYLGDPHAGPPEALNRAMGGPPERTFVQRSPPLRPAGAVLSSAEWRVLEALVPDPRASHRAVADATGLSLKVVQRHRKRLVEGGHLLVQPILLDGRLPGALFYEIYAQGSAAEEPARVQRVVGRSWVIDRLDHPVGVLLLCQAEGMGAAIAALNRVLQVDGVEHAELILGHEFRWAPERLQRWCREARAAWEAKRAGAR